MTLQLAHMSSNSACESEGTEDNPDDAKTDPEEGVEADIKDTDDLFGPQGYADEDTLAVKPAVVLIAQLLSMREQIS